MIVAIVQARSGSSRLPGKVLRALAGRPVLVHVLERAAAVHGVERVCCAVPEGDADEPVASLADSCGATVVRGPELDVLERYRRAAGACGAEVVMRLTSDCPFLDPTVSGLVLARFLEERPDYCSNVDPRSWPRGLDTEVFSRAALEAAAAKARAPADREHVTPWIRQNPGYRHLNVARDGQSLADWRWTLDFPEDLEFMETVLAGLGSGAEAPDFEQLRHYIERHPEVARINAHRI